MQAQHGDFDDVGGGALDGVVDGFAFGAQPGLAVAAAEGGFEDGEVAAAAEQRFDITLLAGLQFGLVQVGADAGETAEILLDIFFGFGQRQFGIAGEAEGAHAINQAEVDGFGEAALVVGDLFDGDVVDGGGGGAVDILIGAEGVEQGGVLADVGQDAQFDLGVVAGEELPAGAGDEAAPDLLADVAADGDVLQVGVAAGEAASDGPGLAEAGMDTAVVRVHHFGQGVDVGAFEFAQFAVFQQGFDDAPFIDAG